MDQSSVLSSSESGAFKLHKRKNGITTRSLFVKHWSLDDWSLLQGLKMSLNLKSYADVLRVAVRREASRLQRGE